MNGFLQISWAFFSWSVPSENRRRPIYERGGILCGMISYEGKSPVGIKNAIEGSSMIGFYGTLSQNLRLKLVYPASFKSRGIGEIRENLGEEKTLKSGEHSSLDLSILLI